MTALQKDFAIYRIAVYKPSGDYEYQLFRNGKSIKSVMSDSPYFSYGLINVSPVDNSVSLALRVFETISTVELEDPESFLIPVIIKS